MSRQVELLADEVYAHRMLARAEHGELQTDITCLPAALLIEETLLGLKPLAEQRGVTLAITYPEAPVYLATDLFLERRVAVKVLKLKTVRNPDAIELNVVERRAFPLDAFPLDVFLCSRCPSTASRSRPSARGRRPKWPPSCSPAAASCSRRT